jgi:hypothetical protein
MTTFRFWGRHYEQITGIEPDAVRLLAKSFCGFWVSTLLARTDLIKRIGRFDPAVHYAEDRDFYFRLSLATSFCYVNKPLAVIDRGASPAGSTSRPWDKFEVCLRGQQRMFEKWLRLDSNLPSDVRRTVVQDLRAVHSSWTNWYLETRQYAEARQAVSRAIKYEFTPKLAIKWALTQVAPTLARRISPKAARAYL